VRVGKFDPTRWQRAKELAEQGCWLAEAARRLKVHHATCLYISRKMGFTWGKCPQNRGQERCQFKMTKKPVVSDKLPVSNEPVERVERMMRLACR